MSRTAVRVPRWHRRAPSAVRARSWPPAVWAQRPAAPAFVWVPGLAAVLVAAGAGGLAVAVAAGAQAVCGEGSEAVGCAATAGLWVFGLLFGAALALVAALAHRFSLHQTHK